MLLDRLQLAQQAYERALSLARARATRSSWQRLLTAARNLRAAHADRALAAATRPAGALGGQAHGRAPARHPGSDRGPVPPGVLAVGSPPERAPARCQASGRAARAGGAPWSPDLSGEVERARRLVEQSRHLCERSRALREEFRAMCDARFRG